MENGIRPSIQMAVDSMRNLRLGYAGEQHAQLIRINVASWLDKWPDASINLMLTLPGEKDSYPAKTVLENGELLFLPGLGDTQRPGNGAAYVVATIGDTHLAASATVITEILIRGRGGDTLPEAPEAQAGWVAEVLGAADRAEGAAENAEEAAERAEEAAERAEEANVEMNERIASLTTPFSVTGQSVFCHPVKDSPLKVTTRFYPLQTGEGEASPANIRPIFPQTELSFIHKAEGFSQTHFQALHEPSYGGLYEWHRGMLVKLGKYMALNGQEQGASGAGWQLQVGTEIAKRYFFLDLVKRESYDAPDNVKENGAIMSHFANHPEIRTSNAIQGFRFYNVRDGYTACARLVIRPDMAAFEGADDGETLQNWKSWLANQEAAGAPVEIAYQMAVGAGQRDYEALTLLAGGGENYLQDNFRGGVLTVSGLLDPIWQNEQQNERLDALENGFAGGGENYILPPATKEKLGGVIVGAGLEVDVNGRVNAGVKKEDVDKLSEEITAQNAKITEAEKSIEYINDVLGMEDNKYIFVDTVEEMTDLTKVYVLKSNNHIYTVGDVPSGNPPNEFSVRKLNYRIYVAEHIGETANGYITTEFIPFTQEDVNATITIKNAGYVRTRYGSYTYGSSRCVGYDSDYKPILQAYLGGRTDVGEYFVMNRDGADLVGSVAASNDALKSIFAAADEKLAYIAFCWPVTDAIETDIADKALPAITADDVEDRDFAIYVSTHRSTVRAFVDSGEIYDGGENAIKALQDAIGKKVDVNQGIENSGKVMMVNVNGVVVPKDIATNSGYSSYMEDEITAATERLQAIQYAAPNSATFAFCTDLHYREFRDPVRLQNIMGSVAAISKVCPVELIAFGGDNLADSMGDGREALALAKHFGDILYKNQAVIAAPVMGNHDDNTLKSRTDTGKCLDRYKLKNGDYYTRAWRQIENIPGVCIGSREGLYYYVDLDAQKTRLIFLNCVDVPYIVGEDGALKYAACQDSGYGNEQLNWVANVALDFSDKAMPDEWIVATIQHYTDNPNTTADFYDVSYVTEAHNGQVMLGILHAFNDRTTYSFNRPDGDFACSVDCDFTSAKGKIICRFSGHTHRDRVAVDHGILYISSIGAADSQSEVPDADGVYQTVSGTGDESAWDIFTIDMDHDVVHATRFGAGVSREITFDGHVTYPETDEPDAPTTPTLPYQLASPTVFDGVTTCIDTGVKLFETDIDYTIAMRLTPVGQTNAAEVVFYQSPMLWLGFNANASDYCIRVGSSDAGYGYTGVMKTETAPFALVITHAAGSGKMNYRVLKPDGTIKTVNNFGAVYEATSQSLTLGAQTTSAGTPHNFWAGTINDFQIYDRVWTGDEIAAYLA